MRAARVTPTTRNYLGHLLVRVCIIPRAEPHFGSKLIPSYHSASKQPHQSYYPPQPTTAHHRLSAQRQQSPPDSNSIRSTDSGYSGASPPPSKVHPLQLDTAVMNPAASRAASSSVHVDPSGSGSGSGNGSRRSSESARTMPGPFRRDRS